MSGLKLILTCSITATLVLAVSADAAPKTRKVEAVPGKRYPLHELHGPHMILVTTLRDVDYADGSDGLSAEEAADKIVYQLRRIGIPAYVYKQEETLGDNGRYIARQEGIAIMAGNFPSPDHRHAEVVLRHIQEKFRPSFIDDEKSGAIIVDEAVKKPFKRAFIVANPLRRDLGQEVDPELVKLNSRNGDVSLLKNKGTYSVKVASFSGKAVLQVSGRKSKNGAKSLALFDDSDESASEAWELATALREATKYGYDRDYDAWVFHDQRKSYVTVGSFDSPDDPQVRQLIEEFRAKNKPNPKTGVTQRTPELFSIPKNPVGQSLPDRLWFFDEVPRAIRIPGR